VRDTGGPGVSATRRLVALMATFALLTLVSVSGAVVWWLHAPSSVAVDTGLVWWQRLFLEHAEKASFAHSAGDFEVPNSCTNTVQGRELVTDDQGFVCAASALDASRPGCCLPPAQTGFERFSCESCDAHVGCCTTYEFCVSCCLGPSNRAPIAALTQAHSAAQSLQVCAALCRTSSQSIIAAERQYRLDSKHCFGAQSTGRGG
jgi:hypothetical protein